MEWFNIVLMAFVMSRCYCHSIAIPVSCIDTFSELPFGMVECIQNEEEEVIGDSNCEVNATDITWTKVPSDTGKVSVEFNLLPSRCGFSEYKLFLKVDESISSEDECLQASTFSSLHSERSVDIIGNSSSNGRSIPSCRKRLVSLTVKHHQASCVSSSGYNLDKSTFRHGKVSVEFNLLPSRCGFSEYKLFLKVDESISSEDECLQASTFSSLHSERSVDIIGNSSSNGRSIPSCRKTETVTFNYVFTGCYILELAPGTLGFSDVLHKSAPKFLETDYKKNLLVNKNLSISSQYNPVGKEVSFTMNNFMKLNLTRMELELRKCDSFPCTCTYGIKHHWWEMALSPSGQFMCRMKNVKDTSPTCNVFSNGIRCTIQNVTAGYYCVLVELLDDRCMPNTLWNEQGKDCVFNSPPLNVTFSSPLSLPPSTSTPEIWWMLVATFTILLMAFLCVLLYIWRKRRPSPDPDPSCHYEKQPVPIRPKILLLYSRDCQPFMNLMTTFRNVLQEITKCEVYDCFDPALMDRIALNKQDWIRRYLLRSDVKVVVIETTCAVLHQKALFNHFIMAYLEPSWLDSLFLYGLKGLTDDIEKNTYGRVFVVRFHGLTEDDYELSHLTPYTRYIIPQHLEKLLNSLYQMKMHHSQSGITAAKHSMQNSEYTLCRDENTDSSIQKLQEDIKNVENYKKQNPNYLDTLLARTSTVSV